MSSLPTGLLALTAVVLVSCLATDGVQIPGSVVDLSEESRAETTEGIFLENDSVEPEIEAAEVGEVIEELDADPEQPMLAVYEPRILEEPLPEVNDRVDEVTAAFPFRIAAVPPSKKRL